MIAGMPACAAGRAACVQMQQCRVDAGKSWGLVTVCCVTRPRACFWDVSACLTWLGRQRARGFRLSGLPSHVLCVHLGHHTQLETSV